MRCFFQIHCNTVRDRDGREVFLFHPNTEYWKNWLQERWLSDTWKGDERVSGSMALFDSDDPKSDLVYAKSQISERLEQIPLPGKAYKSEWKVIDRHNNHFLDAGGYACAAASCLGVRLVEDEEPQQAIAVVQHREPKRFLDPYGRPFLASRR